MDVAEIARVCHEVNRAYCLALGDETQFAWEDAPQWQRDSALAGVRLHLDHPETGPQASHEAWMHQKLYEGWSWGAEKDTVAKRYPCLVLYEDLPPEQRAKDFIFCGIVRALRSA